MFLSSPLLEQVPNLFHGFGTTLEPIPHESQISWAERRPIWKQVHGDAFTEVFKPQQECGSVDGLFTSSRHTPIAVMTADCVPILLARKDGKAAAAIHAGWRGTVKKAIRHLWEELARRGESSADWYAAIGPCMGPCCYEVGPEVVAQFHSAFPHLNPQTYLTASRHLDLQFVNRTELQDLGFREIDVLHPCTFCKLEENRPLFFSHRRKPGEGRQYSVIQLI